MARLAPLAIATTLVLLLAHPALAAPRVAVLPVEFEGRVPEMSKISLSERLVEGLAQAGFEVSAGDALKSALPNQACHDAPCYRQVAAKLGLAFLVIAQVKIREKNYTLKLQLVRGRDGKPAAPEEREACELCGIQEVGAKLDKLASSLMAKVGTPRAEAARLTVQSEPSGASVTVDGRAAGETPLSLNDLTPGAHEVAVSAADHATAQKQVILEPGIRGLLSVNLIPVSPRSGVVMTPGAWRTVGIASMAVGAAAVGAGLLVLKYADHKPVLCPGRTVIPRPGEDAPRCYQNAKLPAGMLIGGGAVVMVAGGLILLVDWSPGRGSGAIAQPRHWMVSAGGTF